MERFQHKATMREHATERDYECDRCGARAVVALEAVGRSGWHQERLHRSEIAAVGAARAEAENDLRIDVDRLLRMIRCPSCNRRAPRAIAWMIVRVAFWIGFGIAGVSLLRAAEEPVAAVYAMVGACIGAGMQLWYEVSRVLRARRVTVLRLTPGDKPVERPSPEQAKAAKAKQPRRPRLPAARAITTPAIEPARRPPANAAPAPVPVPVLASTPPAVVPAPVPGAQPRFLVGRDES